MSRRGSGLRGRERLAGLVFTTPMVVILGLFLVVPIAMAAWVSLLDWTPADGDPFAGAGDYVGTDNYQALLLSDGLARQDFMISIRNTVYYVGFVVPLQTALALLLAMVINERRLRGRGFFRTAFYFPSVTSSIAISMVFLFLFQGTGAVNALLGWFGLDGPRWFTDARGVIHQLFGGLQLVETADPPGWLTGNDIVGLSLWDWLAGPSVALTAVIALVVWTTAGTFMLMFIAALQDIPREVEEAARIDGAGTWQKFRYVTLPQLRPVLILVLTLGLIGTWQVFDQVYILGQGEPQKTTLTPAFLSFRQSFSNGEWGLGAAIAFVLFAIILVLSGIQRFLLRDKDARAAQRRTRAARRADAKVPVA
ncbi:MAG: sugar ABC transporter permease [Actinomycetota bacterium]|nr:sugar ABC transporter permease [Actinomycetota bacterium]